MNKPFYHTITEYLWPEANKAEKPMLFELLITLAVLCCASSLHFLFRLSGNDITATMIFNAGIVITSLLALYLLIKNRINDVMNTAFTVPLFVYSYYISDFSVHPKITGTVYQSVAVLLAGAFFLLYFSKSQSKIIIYAILSFLTLIFHLLKADQFFGFFAGPDNIIPHPLIFFTLIFSGGFLIHRKFKNMVAQQNENITEIKQGISKVLRDTNFPVAEITYTRDEQGNIINFIIDKVNSSFESKFNIHLHEVKGQEANYIFDLVTHEHLDLNRLLLHNNKRIKELYVSKLDLWFRIYVLKPGLNSFYIILEDITKAKNKLKELEISKQRYKVLLEAIPDMFFVIGEDGTYEDFVIKNSDLYKMEDANIVGNNIFEVGFPDNMAHKIMRCIRNCIKRNTIETIEYSLNTPNGTYMFEMRLAKLTSRSVISVSRDITRRKTAELNLEKAKVKAEESDRLKSAFLANLSHEIRTPLNIITNFTRMLTEEGLSNTERTELADAITQNGNQLLNMIDNTIHLSRIETNTVDYSNNFCNVNNVMRDIYNRFRVMIPDSRQVTMHLNIDVPNSEFGFITDRRLLMESIQILVDNAIKYTTKGQIYIGYEMMRNEMVKFTISDTGIGIPQEEMMNIFSRFYRIRNNINDITSGSGIGLSIAQHYVQLLGGELRMESIPGNGTTFWFTLPFREGKGYLRVVS